MDGTHPYHARLQVKVLAVVAAASVCFVSKQKAPSHMLWLLVLLLATPAIDRCVGRGATPCVPLTVLRTLPMARSFVLSCMWTLAPQLPGIHGYSLCSARGWG
jgi:hypothetical protein